MILVTGASGLLGINFVLTAQKRKQNVTAVFNTHTIQIPGVQCTKLDLRDATTAINYIRKIRPAWILHCVALTNIEFCENHPEEALQINVGISKMLVSAAKEIGARIIYVSTDSVFDGMRGNYTEEDIPLPLNVYAKTKLEGEMMIPSDHLILRTNIFGWNTQPKLSLAEWILNELKEERPISGFKDVIFAPILANDLSEIILDLIELKASGTYHVAGSEPCSKYEFAIQLARLFGYNAHLIQSGSISESSLKVLRPHKTWLNTSKVSNLLKRTMPDLKSGLEKFKQLLDSGEVNELKRFFTGSVYAKN
jgi:dTDP-4-dehydrorhamnose reductase